MNTGDIAIVVGGVQNHIPLITRLKARGYYTILIDYLDEPRAKAFADEHIQVSTFDFGLAVTDHARFFFIMLHFRFPPNQ